MTNKELKYNDYIIQEHLKNLQVSVVLCAEKGYHAQVVGIFTDPDLAVATALTLQKAVNEENNYTQYICYDDIPLNKIHIDHANLILAESSISLSNNKDLPKPDDIIN